MTPTLKEQTPDLISREPEALGRLRALERALSNRRIGFNEAFSATYGAQPGGRKRAFKHDVQTLLKALEANPLTTEVKS